MRLIKKREQGGYSALKRVLLCNLKNIKYYVVPLDNSRLRLIMLKICTFISLPLSARCLSPNKNAKVTKERCLICSRCSVASYFVVKAIISQVGATLSDTLFIHNITG